MTSRYIMRFISLALLAGSNTFAADLEVITDDGREVLLQEDGRWEYRSTDRFASTKDGRRIRLKEDGSWSYAGNAPLQSKQQVRTSDLDMILQKVVIEKFEKKVMKNTRVKTQTVFYVHINNSPQAKNTISIKNNDISLIEVKDNNGKAYPVLSLQAVTQQAAPDTEIVLTVRAEKSPSALDDVKSMSITFNKGIFDLDAPVTLSMRVIDFYEENVDGFE